MPWVITHLNKQSLGSKRSTSIRWYGGWGNVLKAKRWNKADCPKIAFRSQLKILLISFESFQILWQAMSRIRTQVNVISVDHCCCVVFISAYLDVTRLGRGGLEPVNFDLRGLVGLASGWVEASVEGTTGWRAARGRLERENSGLGLGVLYLLRLIWLACRDKVRISP